MVPRPDEPTLLRAVARFLDQDVRPGVADPSVAFRLRIAAHLLATTAVHLERGEALERGAIAELAALLGVEIGADQPRREALEGLHRTLCDQLASGSVDRVGAMEWLQETLRTELAITSPRFDTRLNVESG